MNVLDVGDAGDMAGRHKQPARRLLAHIRASLRDYPELEQPPKCPACEDRVYPDEMESHYDVWHGGEA